MLACGLKSITKASSSTGKRIDMQKYVSDCLGVTPGIRISNAKSDEPIGMTGLVVPRQSLETGLVVSLIHWKRECESAASPGRLSSSTSKSSSDARRGPAMSLERRWAGAGAGAATAWPGRGVRTSGAAGGDAAGPRGPSGARRAGGGDHSGLGSRAAPPPPGSS